MASTYSTILRIELIADGEQDSSWGATLRTQLGTIMEAAIAGRSAVTHDDTAAYTLTTNNGSADEARRAILNIGGALTAARNTVCPTQSKLYVVKNATTGGFATTLKTSAGTGISIPNGKTTFLMCDGTNVVSAIDYLDTLTVGNGLTVTAGNVAVSAGTLAVTKATAGDVATFTNGGATPQTAYILSSSQYVAFGDTASLAGTHFFVDVTNTTANIQVGNSIRATWSATELSLTGTEAVTANVNDRVLTINNTNTTANASIGGIYINYTAASPNSASFVFLRGEDSTTTRFRMASNGGLANFQANNVDLSTRAVKHGYAVYTEDKLLKYESFLEAVDFGVWKYKDQTHDDWNHGPTVEGVESALRSHGLVDEESSLIDMFDPERGLKGLVTHDLTNLAVASLVASNKRLRARVSALEARMQ